MRLLISRTQSLVAIMWTIVGISFIQGVYAFSPLYTESVATNGLQPFAAALASPLLIKLYAASLLVSAIIIAYGLITKQSKFRSAGLFAQGLIRTYNLLTTFLIAGLLPLTWYAPLFMVLVCFILWASERFRLNGTT